MKLSMFKKGLPCVMLFVILCSLGFTQKAYAITGKGETKLEPSSFKKWVKDAELDYSINKVKGEDYNIDVNVDSQCGEGEYSSVFLYENKNRTITNCDAISFKLKNDKDEALQLNVTLTNNKKQSASLIDGEYAIAEDLDEQQGQLLLAEYGRFEVPANFDGTIYIPFSHLKTENGDNVNLSRIVSWGVTTVLEMDQKAEYNISDITLWKDSEIKQNERYFQIEIDGSNQVQIPSAGEGITKYTAVVKDLDGNELDTPVVFSLAEEVEGATLSEDGQLVVTPKLAESTLTIEVSTATSKNMATLAVETYVSWRGSYEVGLAQIPDEDADESIIPTYMTVLNSHIVMVRVTCIVILAILIIIMVHWHDISKEKYKILEQKICKDRKEED
ncbi:MAG: hypothetical protein ACERKZ_17160 [Lachnotalea sp.]